MNNLKDETSWNTLFLNPNTVLEAIFKKFGISKAELYSQDHNDQAVKLALAETEVLNETKAWLKNQGISLDFMETDRARCQRSATCILIKNLPQSTTLKGIRSLFEYYGELSHFQLCPNKAIAIADYSNEQFSQNAFQNLQHYVYKNEPLYLEYAPTGLLQVQAPRAAPGLSEAPEDVNARILFVKNLNFSTSEQALLAHFQREGGAVVSARVIQKDGQSLGYGFVEFKEAGDVAAALKHRQHSILDGHSLKLSISKAGLPPAAPNKRKAKEHQGQAESTKLVVRNIAFEATKEDVAALFKHYGEVKSVRMPKKADGNHRGFCFIDFMTIDEANKAFKTLQNTHLYGRKLNFEWAKQNNADGLVKLN